MGTSKNAAYALLILAVCLWGTAGTVSSIAMDEGASVTQLTAFAFVISSLVFLPLVALFDRQSLRIKRKDFPEFLMFSIAAGVFLNLAFFGAIHLTSVTLTIVLNFSYPSIVTVASFFLFGEKMSLGKILALPLTFTGCVLVALAQDLGEGISFGVLGILLGLGSACGSAAYYLWGKKLEERYSPITVVLYLFVLSAIMLVMVANPISLANASIPATAWIFIFVLALFPGIIGFATSMIALKHIEASKASIVSSIEPVIAVALAFAILSEKVTSVQLVGVALVFIGVLLLRLERNAV